MAEFRMPALGADMESGTLVEWKVQPGARVRRGDLVATVETVKGAIEIEVFLDGVVEELVARPGEVVPVGAPLARISVEGEAPGAAAASSGAGATAAPVPSLSPALQKDVPTPVSPSGVEGPSTGSRRAVVANSWGAVLSGEVSGAAPASPSGAEVSGTARRAAPEGSSVGEVSGMASRAAPAGTLGEVSGRAPGPAPGRRPRASPVARRMAEELRVDLAQVKGSGPQGEVLRADLEAWAARGRGAEVAPAVRKGGFDPAAMRAAVAAAMSRSKREIPHYYLSTEVDFSRGLAWLEATNRTRSVAERLLPAALLLKATARALQEVPELNGTYEAGVAHVSAAVHLGVAIHLRGGGLIAPAIHDAQALSVFELMERLTSLVARARTGGLRSSELSAPTVTVTNLGDQGVSQVFPVIMPPQVAMVGFGRVQLRPWVVDGLVAPRSTVVASLAADHRVSDGHRGARFLSALERLLQQPEAP